MESGNGGGGEDELTRMAELSKTLKEGERIVAPTRRPDGTLRKPIRIRAGDVPQDEVAIYQSKGALLKKELMHLQELPPGYDPVIDAKPKTKSVKRNERKKEKRLQAALEKGKNLEDVVDGETNVETKGSSKLNIAIIHPDLGLGGAERLIVDAAVELVSHGHNVHVFTAHHDTTRCFEETVDGTFPVTVYGDFLPRHIFYRLHAVCAYLRCIFVALCVLLKWSSFDIILADQVSVVIPLFRLKRSTKVLFYCHFPDMLLAQHTTLLRRIYRRPIDFVEEITTGMADMILVNSGFTATTFANTFKHLDARGIRPSVLYPAVNVDQFDEPQSYKLNILSINRFERKKNIDLAVSAFSMLQNHQGDVLKNCDMANITLTIAGGYDKRLRENVEYLEELKRLAERNGVLDRVNFVTSCSTAERNALLSECLCVLYTPKDEHFGIVPLEAMAAHKPVIACNSGGPVETIKNGVTGFLCDPNPEEFSLAMAKLIQDPQIAKTMGSEAWQHVTESFSTKIFGQRLNQFLLEITRSKEE